MGRKKKEIIEETEDNLIAKNTEAEAQEESVEDEIKIKKTATGINYTGKVTISVLNGNRVVSKNQYHNAGTEYLFSFLCNCLCGKASSLERPTMIRLFTIDADDSPENPHWNSDTIASSPVIYDIPPLPGRIDGDPNGYKVLYHFRIPYSFLRRFEIAKMALYAPANVDGLEKMSAYFLITEQGVFKPIPLPVSAYNNYSIVVEWELQITNNK